MTTNFLQIVKRVIHQESEAVKHLAENLPKDLTKAINAILSTKGKVIIGGIGKSGYIARKLAASFASTGTAASFIHPAEASHGDLGMISNEDIVILISNSGETNELFSIINYCKRFDIQIIAITTSTNSTLAKKADYILNIPKVTEASIVDAPTTSTIVSLALGDAIMVAVHEAKGFTKEKFGLLHPGGKLGAKLLKVGDLMHKEDAIPAVKPCTLMSEVLITISKKGFGCAVIVEDFTPIGIITDGDLRRHMNDNIINLTARDVMNNNPKIVQVNTLASEALNIMNTKGITSLIIIDELDKLTGIIHLHDILRAKVT